MLAHASGAALVARNTGDTSAMPCLKGLASALHPGPQGWPSPKSFLRNPGGNTPAVRAGLGLGQATQSNPLSNFVRSVPNPLSYHVQPFVLPCPTFSYHFQPLVLPRPTSCSTMSNPLSYNVQPFVLLGPTHAPPFALPCPTLSYHIHPLCPTMFNRVLPYPTPCPTMFNP